MLLLFLLKYFYTAEAWYLGYVRRCSNGWRRGRWREHPIAPRWDQRFLARTCWQIRFCLYLSTCNAVKPMYGFQISIFVHIHQICLHFIIAIFYFCENLKGLNRRLKMELDVKSLFRLHVNSCTHWLRPRPPPRIWTHIRGRCCSTKIDDISLWPPVLKAEFSFRRFHLC